MIDTTKLTETLIEGRKLAAQIIEGMEDGGTCNFDAVFLPTGRGRQIGRKSDKVVKAVEAAGCTCFHVGSGYRKGYVVNVGLGGQGSTRTKAAERVRHHLEDAGFEVSMWYQMD